MDKKLIISRLDNLIWTALFEEERIVELYCSSIENSKISLDDIYVGKVKNIVHNIQAAFVEIADHVECYYSMNENPQPVFTNKVGKKPLCIGDELLVQVSKEALKTKVPTVSSKLTFKGKYVVLTVGDTRVGVSNKIDKTSRERLQSLAQPFVTDAYGFIVRTNAKEVDEAIIIEEMKYLISEYEKMMQTARTRITFSCLKRGEKQYLTKLLDIYQNGQIEIVVEDVELYDEIKAFLENHQPEDIKNLRLYQDKMLPLHKLYSLEKEIEQALRERVWLKSGAYLVIQPTEALTVIDVNTGKCVSKKKDDETMLKINLEAAVEAARQIRLRNLSGIIVIDFINMDKESSMQTMLETFQRELKKDAITTTLVDVTKLQLVEVTRKKVRKPLHEAVRE